MFKSLAAIASLAVLFSSVQADLFDNACPGISLAMPDHGVCRCTVPVTATRKPFHEGCGAHLKNLWGVEWCDTYCHKGQGPSPVPRKKRQNASTVMLTDDSLDTGRTSPCNTPTSACPVFASDDLRKAGKASELTCVNFSMDSENCGGCTSLDQGTNCAKITGVDHSSCVAGQCQVYSCQPGYILTASTSTTSVRGKIRSVTQSACVADN